MKREVITGDVDFNMLRESKQIPSLIRASKSQCDTLNTILEILRKAYPDNFQITFRADLLVLKVFVDILFPEITITNKTRKSQHKITDIMVRIAIDVRTGDNLSIVSIHGTRFSYTQAEIMSGYTHSHLSASTSNTFAPWGIFFSGNYYDSIVKPERLYKDVIEGVFNPFSSFCLGHGGIGKFMMLLNSSKEAQQDANNWIMFFKSVKPYLEYESLEGGPYRRYGEISSRVSYSGGYISENSIHPSRAVGLLRDNVGVIFPIINKLITDNVIQLGLDDNNNIIYQDNDYEGKTEKELHTALSEVPSIRRSGKLSNCTFIRTKSDLGFVYSLPSSGRRRYLFTPENIETIEKYVFPFRNGVIPSRVTDKSFLVRDNSVIETVIHPSIVKKLINYYVTACNRKKAANANNHGKCKTSFADF